MIGARASLAALAALGLGFGLTPAGRVPTTMQQVQELPTAASAAKRITTAPSLPALDIRRLLDMRGSAPGPSYPSNTGWTNRRYQRAALKRRNRIANRRNHRG